MNDELNNIGDVFKKRLKDLKLESNDQLWDRLEQRLATQPVVTPKKAFLHSSGVSWVTVAAAASLITFISFAAIYFSTKNDVPAISDNRQINNTQNKAINTTKDSTITINKKNENNNTVENDINGLNPRNSNDIDIKNNVDPNKQYPKQVVVTDNKNQNPSNNTPNTNNNNTTYPQNQYTNNYNNTPFNNNTNSVTQPNNATNNGKTIKPLNNQTNPSTLQAINAKVVGPKDTARIIPQNNNTTVNNNVEVVNKPESDIKDVRIPNIFTPNGDGYNDYFVILYLDNYTRTELSVTDRYGKVVYEKKNYQNEWDGRNIPDGVYYYTFVYYLQDVKKVKAGSVTIRR